MTKFVLLRLLLFCIELTMTIILNVWHVDFEMQLILEKIAAAVVLAKILTPPKWYYKSE